MFAALATLLLVTTAHAQNPAEKGIVLRNLANTRFFGAAANTSFLYIDKNYTRIISTQVCRLSCTIAREANWLFLQYSIFTPENESEPLQLMLHLYPHAYQD